MPWVVGSWSVSAEAFLCAPSRPLRYLRLIRKTTAEDAEERRRIDAFRVTIRADQRYAVSANQRLIRHETSAKQPLVRAAVWE